MSPKDLSRATVQSRLRLLRQLLTDLDAIGDPDPAQLRRDRLTMLALERILTQLVDLAVDINQHVAASLTDSVTTEYRPSFDDAAALGLISAELADSLKPSVGMRNVLTHEYVNVDLDLVAASIPAARQQYGDYVRSVARWLAELD